MVRDSGIVLPNTGQSRDEALKAMLFAKALRYITTAGTLRLTDANGRVYEFAGADGPGVVVRLTDPSLKRKILIKS